MCSRLLQKMDNFQGDLADILLSGSAAPAEEVSATAAMITDDWQFPSNSKDFLQIADQEQLDEFGDPFSNMRDSLLHEIDMPSSDFFASSSSTSSDIIRPSSFGGGGNTMVVTQGIPDDEIIRRRQPCNNHNSSNGHIFSTMLLIPPNAKLSVSPRDSSSQAAAASPLVTKHMIKSTTAALNNSEGSLVENGGVQQISSPRSTGLKRRKSQAKKVVCIPAPAPANSRPSGEIVPSDLWAWRKYGQKPIKGSPYPRGYYRCSSSKGCSARKQVERSRADPNMLVITYTSEHNHPWPTHRNALAGSSRTQPAKTGSTSKTSQPQKSTNLKEEEKETGNDNASSSPIITPSSSTGPPLKEEMDDQDKHMGMDDVHQFSEGFQQTYRPALPYPNHSEDIFADLAELEADRLNLLFAQGYSGDEVPENKSLDPFSFYDWVHSTTDVTATTTTATMTTSVEEVNKGL